MRLGAQDAGPIGDLAFAHPAEEIEVVDTLIDDLPAAEPVDVNDVSDSADEPDEDEDDEW